MDKQSERKTSKLAMCALIGPVLGFLLMFAGGTIVPEYMQLYVMITTFVMLCLSIPFGIIALIQIYLSNGSLGGADCARGGILLGGFFMIMLASTPFLGITTELAHKLVCRTNLKHLAERARAYANVNEGVLPGHDWCDRLIIEGNMSWNNFICRTSDCEKGESSYALNAEAAGKKLSELPDDMVLFFETDQGIEGERAKLEYGRACESNDIFTNKKSGKVYNGRWNQVGDVEIVNSVRHIKGCNVAYVNGKAEYYKDESGLADIRWNTAGTEITLPEPKEAGRDWQKHGNIGLGYSIFVIGIGLISAIKYRPIKRLRFALVLSVLAVIAGLLLGSWGEELYKPFDAKPGWIDAFSVCSMAILFFLAGIVYIGILERTICKVKDFANQRKYIITVGMAMGLVCSCIAHGLFMILLKPVPYGIVGGMPFGVIAGGVLGWITGAFLEPKTLKVKNGVSGD